MHRFNVHLYPTRRGGIVDLFLFVLPGGCEFIVYGWSNQEHMRPEAT